MIVFTAPRKATWYSTVSASTTSPLTDALRRAPRPRALPSRRAMPIPRRGPGINPGDAQTGFSPTSSDLPEPEPTLVTSSGRYYVVYTAGTRTFLSERPLTERLFELGAIAAGALALRRAWRD